MAWCDPLVPKPIACRRVLPEDVYQSSPDWILECATFQLVRDVQVAYLCMLVHVEDELTGEQHACAGFSPPFTACTEPFYELRAPAFRERSWPLAQDQAWPDILARIVQDLASEPVVYSRVRPAPTLVFHQSRLHWGATGDALFVFDREDIGAMALRVNATELTPVRLDRFNSSVRATYTSLQEVGVPFDPRWMHDPRVTAVLRFVDSSGSEATHPMVVDVCISCAYCSPHRVAESSPEPDSCVGADQPEAPRPANTAQPEGRSVDTDTGLSLEVRSTHNDDSPDVHEPPDKHATDSTTDAEPTRVLKRARLESDVTAGVTIRLDARRLADAHRKRALAAAEQADRFRMGLGADGAVPTVSNTRRPLLPRGFQLAGFAKRHPKRTRATLTHETPSGYRIQGLANDERVMCAMNSAVQLLRIAMGSNGLEDPGLACSTDLTVLARIALGLTLDHAPADVHEVLLRLFASNQLTPVEKRRFAVATRTTRCCQRCGSSTRSTAQDYFLHLSVGERPGAVPLGRLVHQALHPEHPTQAGCTVCGRTTAHVERTSFEGAPQQLAVLFKRWTERGVFTRRPVALPPEVWFGSTRYALRATVTFHDAQQHYTVCAETDTSWVNINDERIEPCSAPEISDDCYVALFSAQHREQ